MTTYELPPLPPIGARVRAAGGEEFYRRDDGLWNSFDGRRTGGDWGWLVGYFAPLTLIEPDPWPTEPLIVASVDGGGPQLLVIQDDHTAMTMTGALCRRDRNTLTNVVPVHVVPVAALPVLWSALEQWLNGPRDALDNDMRRLAGAVVGLREQIDALGVDL